MTTELRTGATRTGTPLIVGYIISALVEQGYNLTGNTQVLLALASSWVYYVGARFLEVHLDAKWSYILGSRKTPVYTTPPAMGVDAQGEFSVGDDGVERVE